MFNTEAVIEFLGCVPLLQKLPSSSLRKIEQVVTVKHYDPQEYVVREGEAGNGIYFIWEGQAEVSGYFHGDEHNQSEFQLKRCDYFGNAVAVSVQQADVIAMTKLICLVLPNEHFNLLQSKSIWSVEQTNETCSFVERILHLEPIDMDIFKGVTLPEAPHYGKVFGGQFIGQALAAATKTVDSLKIVHSLHAYFLLVGDLGIPVIYHVHRVRDGNSFATRRIDAIQNGSLIFTMFASFQKEEVGFIHQLPSMPAVPDPELLLSMEDLREIRLTNPRLPRMWFHRPLRADEWLLFEISSPTAYNARGFVNGQMFNQKGELVASITQQGLIRETRTPSSPAVSKL